MAEDETEQEPTSPQDARLTSLEERLKRAEQVEVERRPAGRFGEGHSLCRMDGGAEFDRNARSAAL